MATLFSVDARSVYLQPDALRSAYYGDGAFIVRQLLPLPAIEAVARQIVALISLMDATVADACPASAVNDAVKKASWMLQEVERRHPGSQGAIYDAMDHTPLMHQIAASAELMKVLHIILSPHLLIHPRLIVLMSMPKGTWHLARWHQDFYYNEGPQSTCTVYAPLQYTDARNGGLIIAKKSLTKGPLPHGDHEYGAPTKWKTLAPEAVAEFDELSQIEMQPGDVLFLHSLAAHTAQLNESEDVRFVVNLRYRDMLDEEFRADKWRVGSIPEARMALARKTPPEKSNP